MKVRPLRIDLSGTLCQDRPTMPEASSALCQGQTSPAVTGNGERVWRALHQETKR